MSTPSYRRINYGLRPAKSIERKMFITLCERLRSLSSLESYRYVGLGSPYFTDFSLMHRSLGLTQLLCIEREVNDQARFDFNRPFNCIDILYGESTEVLTQIDWRHIPSIIWMDYDDPISENTLTDIATIMGGAEAGSLAMLTVRAQANDFGHTPDERLEELRTRFPDRAPANAASKDVTATNFAALVWRMIDGEIRRVLEERTTALPSGNRFEYLQLVHFRYSDSTPMITVGGLFFQAGQRTLVQQCDFESLDFVRFDSEPFKIRVPKLTFKEQRYIESQLPNGAFPGSPGVPSQDIPAYRASYRHFPTFAEAEVI